MDAIYTHFSRNHFYSLCKEVLSDLAKRIILFVKRHQSSFIVYAIEAGCMFLAGNRISRIVLTVTGGLGWQLGYSEGAVLPEDLIEKYKKNSDTYLYPSEDLITSSNAISLRIMKIENLLEKIAPSVHPDWLFSSLSSALAKNQIYRDTFITGQTGTGKTKILHCIADRLLRDEKNLVYFLKKDFKIGFTNSFSQFATIREYLNSQGEHQRVYLLIDEFADAVNISENLLLGIKNTDLIRFNIIASMVEPPKKMKEISKEMGRRFETIEIEPLDSRGVYEIEKKVKSKYGTIIEDQVLEKTVSLVFNHTSQDDISLCHSRVSKLLEEASSEKILNNSPSQKKHHLKIEDIWKKLKQTQWFEQSTIKKLEQKLPKKFKKNKYRLKLVLQLAYKNYDDLDKMREFANERLTPQYRSPPLVNKCNDENLEIYYGASVSPQDYCNFLKKSGEISE